MSKGAGDGRKIDEAWKDGPEAYFGVTTSGFPNLFMLYGPNTNGGNSIILMLEFQIDYMLRLIGEADRAGIDWVDVRREVMDEYNAGLQQELESVAVWQAGANDYYRSSRRQDCHPVPPRHVDVPRPGRRGRPRGLRGR